MKGLYMKLIFVMVLIFSTSIFAKGLNLSDYRKACHEGNGYACQETAKKYFIYGNQTNARTYMWKACDLKVPGTCRMAKIYELINR